MWWSTVCGAALQNSSLRQLRIKIPLPYLSSIISNLVQFSALVHSTVSQAVISVEEAICSREKQTSCQEHGSRNSTAEAKFHATTFWWRRNQMYKYNMGNSTLATIQHNLSSELESTTNSVWAGGAMPLQKISRWTAASNQAWLWNVAAGGIKEIGGQQLSAVAFPVNGL